MSNKARTGSLITDIHVEAVVGPTVSLAIITVDGEVYVGESKRAAGDPWSGETGINIAVGRALVTAGEELLRRRGVDTLGVRQ